jgi:hydroxyacylglutathione hydrolase
LVRPDEPKYFTQIANPWGGQFVNQPDICLARIVSVPFEENCFVAHLEGRSDCLIVDPGLEPDKIIEYLDKQKLTPAAILNTHGHGDHIGGNAALKQRFPACQLVIGAREAPKLRDAELNLSAVFWVPITSPPADVTVSEGDTFSAAGLDLEVREIPGHSAGHVVYIWKDHNPAIVFVGDVIFAGSVGRSDFPDGDFGQLAAGIRTKLYTLPEATMLLPGHGPATTVGQEKRTNPYVRGEA